MTRSVPSSVPSGSLWSRTVPRSPVPGEGSRHFCPHCILSEPSRTQRSQMLEGAKLYFHREEMGQGQLPTVGVGPPAGGLSRWWVQGTWPMWTPLCRRGRSLFPAVEGRSSTAAGQVPCHTHALEQDRPLCPKQGKMIPHGAGGAGPCSPRKPSLGS